MADSVITEPNGAAVTLAGWQNIISKLTKQSKGLAALSFDSYAESATAPSVVAGGIYEINGTYYQVDSDTLITGMSTVSTSYYIYSTSGTWSSSTTAPAWDEARNGWYHPTVVTARCFFKVTTDSGGEYDTRTSMPQKTRYNQDHFIDGDLEVTGALSVDGDSTFSGDVTLGEGAIVTFAKSSFDATSTEAAIYLSIKTRIGNGVGGECIACGGGELSATANVFPTGVRNGNFIAAYARYASATSFLLSGYCVTTGDFCVITIRSGNATVTFNESAIAFR